MGRGNEEMMSNVRGQMENRNNEKMLFGVGAIFKVINFSLSVFSRRKKKVIENDQKITIYKSY